MAEPVEGPRARYREQVRAEIERHAWTQVERAGAAALSLKSIATQMGMTAPALYRYVASRDELVTELVLAAYADLAGTAEAAATGPDPAERLRRVARSLHTWAMTHPQRYLLLYGTPVPGYVAPPAATELARRILAPVVAAFAELAGQPSLGQDDASAEVLARAVTFWTRVHGVLSLTVAGHFDGMGVDVAGLLAQEVGSLVEAG